MTSRFNSGWPNSWTNDPWSVHFYGSINSLKTLVLEYDKFMEKDISRMMHFKNIWDILRMMHAWGIWTIDLYFGLLNCDHNWVWGHFFSQNPNHPRKLKKSHKNIFGFELWSNGLNWHFNVYKIVNQESELSMYSIFRSLFGIMDNG